MPGRLIIDADSSRAVKAMNLLRGSMVEANQGAELLSKGFNKIAATIEQFEQMAIEGSKLRTQMERLGPSGAASLQLMRRATDDLISSDQLMRASYALTRNGLQLTAEQFEAVTKGAVEFSRAGGEDVAIVLDRLAKGITGGTVSAVNDFGFALDESGTIADKQKRILDALVQKYKDVEISAKGTAEEITSADNAYKASLITKGQGIENVVSLWSGFKNVVRDTANNMLSFKSAAMETYEWIKRMDDGTADLTDKTIELGRKTTDVIIERARLEQSGLQYSLDYQALTKKQIDLTKQQLVARRQMMLNETSAREQEIATLEERAIVLESETGATKENIFEWKRAQKLKADLAKDTARLTKQIKEEESALRDLKKEYQDTATAVELAKNRIQGTIVKWLELGAARVKAYNEAEKKRKAANEAAGKAEASIIAGFREQLVYQEKLIEKIGDKAKLEDFVARERLKIILTLNKRQREEFLASEKIQKTVGERWKADLEAQKKEDAKAAEELKKKTAAEAEYAKQRATWDKARWDRLQGLALAAKKLEDAQRFQFAGAGMTPDTKRNIAQQELELAKAKAVEDEAGIARAKQRIELLKTEANKLGALKTNYSGLFTAGAEAKGMIQAVGKSAIEAAIMESSKLKELGKSRVQFVKEATATILKAKAIEWGAKAIGATAEGTISLVIPGAQGLAPGFFKAAGLYGAAALAAGVMAKGLGAGKAKGGSGAKATAQAPTSMGTESKGTNIVINISESVLGEPDAVAGKIRDMIADGQGRGTVNSWQ